MQYIPTIGSSFEGRAIPAVVVTASAAQDLPSFYIQCLIHAREWISGATCMYVGHANVWLLVQP